MPRDNGFRWRSREVSRIEGLSDAVFGFAVTLLVVSLEVPKTYGDLLANMSGFVAFAASFAILIIIWHAQYVFFRRYGLDTGLTLVLNIVLLFVVLFYVYPLKFLFGLFFDALLNRAHLMVDVGGQMVPRIRSREWPSLLMIYSTGYAAIYTIFTLLYVHAYRMREELELTAVETLLTRATIYEHALLASIGVLSVLLSFLGLPAFGGFIYMLIGPVAYTNGAIWGRRRKRLDAESAARTTAQAVAAG